MLYLPEHNFIATLHLNKIFMKRLLPFVLLLLSFTVKAQHSLEKIWETDSIVNVPESVLHVAGTNQLYVSLINGAPWEMDGKGGIAKLSTDGKNYDSTWVTGLHAPKGMGIIGSKLYVADLTQVVIVNTINGKIENKISVENALQLNDISVSDKGIIYVSDSKAGKVYRIANDKAELYLENLQGVNGLKAVGEDLFIAAGRSFVKADSKKQIQPIAQLLQGGDGVEPIGNGDFLVSAWAGYVFYVHADGKVETLLDTHLEKRNTADFGYDAVNKIVYIPTFFARTIVAYKLK